MDIVLHLGAHKTASTYIQKRLSRSHGRLKRHKVCFHGPKSLRPMLSKAQGDDQNPSSRLAYDRRRDCLTQLIEREEAAGTHRLVLSEEQFLGSLRDMLMGCDFYQDAGERMACIAEVLEDRPVHIMLSVRGYADFLASIYGQVIRGWRFMPFDDTLRANLLGHRLGWSDLIDTINERFPSATQITLWRYEDFDRIEENVLSTLAGPVAQVVKPLAGQPMAAPSQETIDWLHARAAQGCPPDQETVNSAYDAAPKDRGYPAFDPWTPQERSYLDARYRQDLIWLYRLRACTWLRAEESEVA